MDPKELFKNLQGLQSQFSEMQEKLKEITAVGTSGGEMIKVTMNGKFEVINVEIDPICVDPRDVKMLEDLILAASTDANRKIQEALKTQGPNLAGGMFPQGFGG